MRKTERGYIRAENEIETAERKEEKEMDRENGGNEGGVKLERNDGRSGSLRFILEQSLFAVGWILSDLFSNF